MTIEKLSMSKPNAAKPLKELKPFLWVDYRDEHKRWQKIRICNDGSGAPYYSDEDDEDEEAQPNSKKPKTSEQPKSPAKAQRRDSAEVSEAIDLEKPANEVDTSNKSNKSDNSKLSEDSEKLEKLEKPEESEKSEKTGTATAANEGGIPKEANSECADAERSKEAESKKETDPLTCEQSSPLQRLQKLIQENEEPYNGKEANLEESADIISAEMETACLEINTMGEESGTAIVCATSNTPFHGMLSQNGESGLMKICGECGDRKVCFFSIRMKTPVVYGAPREEKREVVESLADGPICSATCLRREALGLLLDHIRLLTIKAKASRAGLKTAITNKIAYLQSKACVLGDEIGAAMATINASKAEQCSTYKNSGQYNDSLAEVGAVAKELSKAFKKLHCWTGGINEEKKACIEPRNKKKKSKNWQNSTPLKFRNSKQSMICSKGMQNSAYTLTQLATRMRR